MKPVVADTSEATYAALRLAHAVTGRTHIASFRAPITADTTPSRCEKLGRPDPLSLGMLADVADKAIVLPSSD